jgi:hypothetical protein
MNAYPILTWLPLNSGNTMRNNKFKIKGGIYKNGSQKGAP